MSISPLGAASSARCGVTLESGGGCCGGGVSRAQLPAELTGLHMTLVLLLLQLLLLLLLLLRPRLVGRVVAVALDLERSARAGELVAHLLEETPEGCHVLAGADQAGAQLVAGIVAASVERGKEKRDN